MKIEGADNKAVVSYRKEKFILIAENQKGMYHDNFCWQYQRYQNKYAYQ